MIACPRAYSIPATVELSTPPLMATATRDPAAMGSDLAGAVVPRGADSVSVSLGIEFETIAL